VLNGFDLSFVSSFDYWWSCGFVAIFGVGRPMWLMRLQWLLQLQRLKRHNVAAMIMQTGF